MKTYKFIASNIDKTTKPSINTDRKDMTLISLPLPFTTPCIGGMFQEMYYWDTFFTNKGLYLLDRKEQAVNNIRNMAWLLEQYGRIPNGNRTGYLTRSQPPFYGCMLEDALHFAPEQNAQKSSLHSGGITLEEAFSWLEKEYVFWQTMRQTENGLNRYSSDVLEEQLPDAVVDYGNRTGIHLDRTAENGRNVLAECESGWDFSPRFPGGCANYNPVDLNCLLYKDELLLSGWAEELGRRATAERYRKCAAERKEMVLTFMKRDGIYYDYNYVDGTLSPVVSCASLFPYYVGLDSSGEDFKKTLEHLEARHGVIACDWDEGRYQWSKPNSWAPLNYIAFAAACELALYGDAERLAEKYLGAVDVLFENTGNLWEKYDANTGLIDMKSEYGTPAMLGWTAGVYVVFYKWISERKEKGKG